MAEATSQTAQPSQAPAKVDLADARYYLNRELSLLEFQRRVLAPPPQGPLVLLPVSLSRPRSGHDPGIARATAPPISLPLRL